MKQKYRCDTCGSEHTRIENAEVVQADYGPVVNIQINCRRCEARNLLQITNTYGNVLMEVIGGKMSKHQPVNEMGFNDLEWP